MNLPVTFFVKTFGEIFPLLKNDFPWGIIGQLPEILSARLNSLNKDEYLINENIAVHKSAIVEPGVVIKDIGIVGPDCFVGAHAYLRGGFFLDSKVSVGPGCEIKTSLIFNSSALAHFNFVGDSIIGSFVNMEAGSVIANHHNDRVEKEITVMIENRKIKTGVSKFGALVGDNVKIGANAVLSPGTILQPGEVVKRLGLVEQNL
jgi:UDP-N-acetylglucosamine diphosphorylase / glucose-1-phosphate thymidylyltransferase / UDP-N-acetylgalactosamine diphosphorylase / glucosamine-1-phosphate N-acetyltransferase / galactosamine-1-phosphate N-acetyltransferase